MQKKVISEHLFIFPFSWKYKAKQGDILFRQHTQIQHKYFDELGHWKSRISTIDTDKDYNEYVYFYKPIRMALYTEPNQAFIVRNYEYKQLTDDSYFEIRYHDRYYRLEIKQIDLKMYKTGIGLLCFRFMNRQYDEIEAIEAINSFSTCIYPAMLPLDKAQKAGLPTRVQLYLNAKLNIIEDFKRDRYTDYLTISPIMMRTLGHLFTTKIRPYSKPMFFVEPILGNQMFCSCMYHNQELVNKIYRGKEDIEDIQNLMTFNKQSHALAEIDKLFGDKGILKCEDHIYSINRYMLLCITKEDTHDKFYDQLAKLTLMQRATLLNLSSELARISTLPKSEVSSAVASIYEIYIQFINQLYFKEVTEDSEGTYIYEELTKVFKIKEELEQLDFEIDEVHEYANLVEQSASNFKVQLLTIIGGALVIPSFVTGFFGMNIFQNEALRWWENTTVGLWLNSYVCLPILAILTICLWTQKRHILNLIFQVLLSIAFIISLTVTIKYGCGA